MNMPVRASQGSYWEKDDVIHRLTFDLWAPCSVVFRWSTILKNRTTAHNRKPHALDSQRVKMLIFICTFIQSWYLNTRMTVLFGVVQFIYNKCLTYNKLYYKGYCCGKTIWMWVINKILHNSFSVMWWFYFRNKHFWIYRLSEK